MIEHEITTNDGFVDFHACQIFDDRIKKDKLGSDVSRSDELY
jgi:hypothetical protein